MTAPENNSHILWHDESCYFFSYVAYHRHQSGRKTVATCSHSRVCSVFLVRPSQEKKHNPDRKHTGLHKTAWGRVVQSCAILYTSPATLLLKYDVSFFDNLSLTHSLWLHFVIRWTSCHPFWVYDNRLVMKSIPQRAESIFLTHWEKIKHHEFYSSVVLDCIVYFFFCLGVHDQDFLKNVMGMLHLKKTVHVKVQCINPTSTDFESHIKRLYHK